MTTTPTGPSCARCCSGASSRGGHDAREVRATGTERQLRDRRWSTCSRTASSQGSPPRCWACRRNPLHRRRAGCGHGPSRSVMFHLPGVTGGRGSPASVAGHLMVVVRCDDETAEADVAAALSSDWGGSQADATPSSRSDPSRRPCRTRNSATVARHVLDAAALGGQRRGRCHGAHGGLAFQPAIIR